MYPFLFNTEIYCVVFWFTFSIVKEYIEKRLRRRNEREIESTKNLYRPDVPRNDFLQVTFQEKKKI